MKKRANKIKCEEDLELLGNERFFINVLNSL
jgi:hypothetical protein